MKDFMDADFLLRTPTAKKLYHDAAADMPIFDYHCHITAREIWEDTKFRNLTHLMLAGDHYKWRLMMANGVPEANIRGEGSDEEKFYAYAATLRQAIGNPLYHWTHLELRRVFGITEVLSKQSAPGIWARANEMLAGPEFSCRNLILRFGVKLIGTTDHPCDDLMYHEKLEADDSFPVRVVPSFRPDPYFQPEKSGFVDQVALLGRVTGVDTLNFDGMIQALENRVDSFHQRGCRVSDHALDTVPYALPSYTIAREAFRKLLAGEPLDAQAIETYKTCVLLSLGRMYRERGWVMQYHIGALRNVNPLALHRLGPDVGFDAMDDLPIAQKLSHLMGQLESEGHLPKTILYSLNPRDNATLAALAGCFQGEEIPGKIQWGSAWWFNDTREGMREQMTTLANMGLLGRFVGMLTDSRSFTSYSRHEYFRRELCDLIGGWVEEGLYPADMKGLKKLVRGICYDNAVKYFGIALKGEAKAEN